MEQVRDRLLQGALQLEHQSAPVQLDAVRKGAEDFEKAFAGHLSARFKKNASDAEIMEYQGKVADLIGRLLDSNQHYADDQFLKEWLDGTLSPKDLDHRKAEQELLKEWINRERTPAEIRESLHQARNSLLSRRMDSFSNLARLKEIRPLDPEAVDRVNRTFKERFLRQLGMDLGRNASREEVLAYQRALAEKLEGLLAANQEYVNDQILNQWKEGRLEAIGGHKEFENKPWAKGRSEILALLDSNVPLPELKASLQEIRDALKAGPLDPAKSIGAPKGFRIVGFSEVLPPIVRKEGLEKLRPENSLDMSHLSSSVFFYGTEAEAFVPGVSAKLAELNKRTWALTDAVQKFTKTNLEELSRKKPKGGVDPVDPASIAHGLDFFSDLVRSSLDEFASFQDEVRVLQQKINEYIAYGKKIPAATAGPDFQTRLLQLQQSSQALDLILKNDGTFRELMRGMAAHLSAFRTAVIAHGANQATAKNGYLNSSAKELTAASRKLTDFTKKNLNLP